MGTLVQKLRAGEQFLARGRVHRRKTHPVRMLAFFYFLRRIPDERQRRRLEVGESLSAPVGSRCKRVPDRVPIKDGYFDKVAVLIVFALKQSKYGDFLTF